MTYRQVHTARPVAREFARTATDLDGELARVTGMLTSLRAGWTGPAADFDAAMDAWVVSLRVIVAELNHLADTHERS
ncbi:WXG100 family type VII secretion target [Actinophytocola oryzae]|uniref:WXG100 family type VII secretion target n=1 Tax=Actinophytocola oryzae TaxID=502181 RepID=A0A4R7VRC5_9PSEU|nr:WXG100 family type VII secretion target [Actinophytocola oryzae]TDV52038.1 WXG100 family type VII secretion target [Actinophytocola oryzae]